MFFRTTIPTLSSGYFRVKDVVIVLVPIRSFLFRIRAFAIVHAYSCGDLSIEIAGLVSPVDPSKFLPLSLLGAPSSAGFLDICEPPHVWMSRRNGAANPERHDVRVAREPCRESESHVRECHRSKSTWCTRIYYERTRTRHANERAQRAVPYVIIIAAHVANRIFRPRIPFSILAKVAAVLRTSCVKFARANSLDASTRFYFEEETRPLIFFVNKNFTLKKQMAIENQKSKSRYS